MYKSRVISGGMIFMPTFMNNYSYSNVKLLLQNKEIKLKVYITFI
jgi:hypothetical protein